MTAPDPHGYPDWVRRGATADVSHLNELAVAFTDLFVRGRFFVGTEHGLGIRCGVIGVSGNLSLQYYATQTGANTVGRQVIELTSLVEIDTVVPVLGPWLDFVATPSALGGTISIRLWSAPVPAHSYVSQADQSCLVRVANVVVAAGAQRDDDAPYVMPGWATWQFQGTGQPFIAELRVLRQSGATSDIARYSLAAGEDRSLIIPLPPNPMRVRVTNSGGGNMNWSAFLTAYPGINGIA